MMLRPMPTARGTARVRDVSPHPGVLGAASAQDEPLAGTLQLETFRQAQPPVELDLLPLQPQPGSPAVLGGPTATTEKEAAFIEFQPDVGEQAVYALLHEIETPEGIVYDITLPQSGVRGGVVLGAGEDADIVPDMLRFPVYRHLDSSKPPDSGEQPAPGVLGSGEVIAGIAGSEVIRHVLHVIKAPLENTLRQSVAAWEGEPFVTTIQPDGTPGELLAGAEAWRARFDPAREHRVLLYMHGFNSSVATSLPINWVRSFGTMYDAVLGYNHPTFTRDPIQNAADLLAQIPPDVRLKADVVAHSRGGLVSRSLVELQPTSPKLQIVRLITCGAPHAGTVIVEHERWDRLISIGFSALSWLTTVSSVGSGITFVTRGLELLLRAGSQFLFDLPGLEAMSPSSSFLRHLNAPSEFAPPVRYAVVSSDFNGIKMAQRNFRHALRSMAAQVFFQLPNDLVVPTTSMSQIDTPTSAPLGERVFQTDVDHFSYFLENDVQNFAETFLVS
jgi:pimeloyl-ACP methyl ester carboxylesterase